jgi:hypothetical protein
MKRKMPILFLTLAALFIALVATSQIYAAPDAFVLTPRPTRTPRPTSTPRPTAVPKVITVEITEAQFFAPFKSEIYGTIKKITVDIVEGQLVLVVEYGDAEGGMLLFHIGANIVKNKVVVELGSLEMNGTTIQVADFRNLAPEAGRSVDNFNASLKRVVTRQISRKVGGRYTVQSAVFTQDKLIITILK